MPERTRQPSENVDTFGPAPRPAAYPPAVLLAPPRRRRLLVALLVLLVAYVGSTGLLAWRLGHRLRPAYAEPAPHLPCCSVTPLRLETDDGLHLGAWAVSPEGDDTTPVVVLVHGVNAARTWVLPYIEAWTDLGAPVLAISLRAHGDSDGDALDFGPDLALDVVAATRAAAARWPGRPVVLHGISLGTSAALHAAPSLPARHYLLESPFLSLDRAIHNRVHRQLPAPVAALAEHTLRAWSHVLAAHPTSAVRPVDAASRVPQDSRWWVVYGTADLLAHPDEALAIADALPSATPVAFPGRGHGGPFRDEAAYRAVMTAVLAAATPP